MEASPSRVPTIISLCIWFKVIVCLYSRSAFPFSVFVLSSTFFFFLGRPSGCLICYIVNRSILFCSYVKTSFIFDFQ